MSGTPTGFRRRKGSRLLRTVIDLPESEAVEVASIAATESAATGEPVTAQSVLRRAVRKGLPLVRASIAEVHPTGTSARLGAAPTPNDPESR